MSFSLLRFESKGAGCGAPIAKPVAMDNTGWQAQLKLRFARQAQRTVLVERRHSGPLVVQKPLYPEGSGICHAIVVHPPGGIAGGDQLQLHASIEADAHALLTTPGAGKWYKANGLSASQQLQFTVGTRATLEWLPQETILFDAAQVHMSTRIDLGVDAKFAGWEILCLGRRAAGEKFAQGQFRQSVQIWRGDELLWNEVAKITADSRATASLAGLSGRTLNAVFLVAAGAVPKDILEACREIEPSEKATNLFGVTALPEIFAARFVGDNAEHAREYFEKLWQVLRPWYANVDMRRPRIWAT